MNILLTMHSLSQAVSENNVELVKQFLSEGANLNCRNEDKKTLLHIAAEKGYSLIFQLLLDKGADIFISDINDETCLDKASRQGNLEIVEILLKQKYMFPSCRVEELFLHAIECNRSDVVQLFLNSFDEDEELLTYLHRATEKKNLKMVKLLSQFRACIDVNSNKCETVFHVACQNVTIDVKNILFSLESDETLNIMKEYTPLQIAVSNENVEDVEILLASATDVNVQNSNGQTSLHLTLSMKSSENFRLGIPKTNESISHEEYSCGDNSPLRVRGSTGKMQQCIQSEINRPYVIELLLKAGSSVNAQDVRGFTVLHYATVLGYIEIINILLKYGGDPNIQSEGGFTPLNLICNYGSNNSKIQNDEIGEKILLNMIEYGGNVNISDKSGNGLLHKACQVGYEKVVSVILKNSGNPNLQNELKETPLHKACMGTSCEKIVSLLLNNGSDSTILDSGGFSALHWACLFGSENNVREILSKGGNPNVQCKFFGFTPLHMIPIEACNKHIALLLMQNGCNPNIPNINEETILHNACIFNCSEIIEIVLTHGGDPYLKNVDGKTPLHLAVINHPLDKSNIATSDLQQTLTVLLNNVNANVLDEEGNTPLHEACRNDFDEHIIKTLINYGGNPLIQNIYLETPLHALFSSSNQYMGCDWTGTNKRKNILLDLLEKGADLNIQNERGDTPFHCACYGEQETIIEVFLENGGNPNIQNNNGCTPLLEVSSYINSEKLISLMLQKGGDVNIQDDEGNTAFHRACYNGWAYSVQGFLNFIENPNLLNKDGETALHIAIKADDLGTPGYSKIVSTVLNAGADVNICYRGETPLEMALSQNRNEITHLLGCHIIMSKCANFHVHLRDLEVLRSDHYFEHFREQCQTELNLLKSSSIGNSSVSYFNILVGTAITLAPLFRNKDLIQVMYTEEYLELFPIYGDLIKLNYKKAIRRKNLQELAWNCCIQIFDSLPILCLDKIFSFLENDDLSVLASL